MQQKGTAQHDSGLARAGQSLSWEAESDVLCRLYA